MKVRIISCAVLLSMAIGLFASSCAQKEGNQLGDTSSKAASSGDWQLPVGPGAPSGGDDFDNTGSGGKQPVPGDHTGNSSSGKHASSGGSKPPAGQPEPESSLPESVLTDKDSLQYYYEGNGYCYGITGGNKESIASIDQHGNKADILAGGGTYEIKNSGGLMLLSAASVSSFEQTVIDNSIALVVTYRAAGQFTDKAILQNTYLFGDNHISVSARISYTNDNYKSSPGRSVLKRIFSNGSQSVDKRFHSDWTYPRDGDYPYLKFDSWVTVNKIDDDHSAYTFVRGNNIPATIWDHQTRYPEMDLPVYFEEGNGISYTQEYDLVLGSAADPKNDYRALFAGRGSDFAAGIAPVGKTADNSTVFTGDEIALNMNVANLTKEDIQFSARYDVRDYYGNIVDAGIFINSTAFASLDANRNIKISASKTGAYGIYYVNYMVISPYYTHRETYPFILVPEHEYKHNLTSPFGINQIPAAEFMPYRDFISIVNKIGVANTRMAGSLDPQKPEMSNYIINELKKKNITMTGSPAARNIENVRDYVNVFKDDIDSFIVGNELNMAAISGQTTIDQAFANYKAKEFDYGYKVVKQEFNKTYVLAGIAAGQGQWYKQVYDNGLWDKFDVISLHAYGFPHAPDYSGSETLWNMENAVMRNRDAIKKYGYKPTDIHEMGAPTVAANKTSLDLRTQADYNIRSYFIALAYGIRSVMSYCFLDHSSAGYGIDLQDSEYHFGAFYYPDYFGRTMPKPFAAAFASMTRQLEDYQKAEFNEKYNKGKTRAVTVTTKSNQKVVVAWSNISPLPNDSPSPNNRKPTPPWKNQWEKNETISFESDNKEVIVRDIMGNGKTYAVKNGKAEIPVNGSPVYIYGVK